MASNIATLNVKLVASIGSFASSMGSAAKPLVSFAGHVGAASAKIGGMIAAASALVGSGAIIALTKSSIDSIDALDDQANALGVTTEALSRLQYASSFAGVGNEALGGSLQKMLKNLNEAQSGTGAAADAFNLLGLDAVKLAQMQPDEAFREIAGAMESIENPAQRTATVMDIFGKSGAALLPVLAQGKDGLAAMAAESDKLGVTIKSTDAAQVAAAADAMDKVQHAITGAANTLAIQLAPYIELAANKLVDLATSGSGVGGKVVAAFEAVVKGVAYAADYLSLLKAGFKLLQAGATLGVFAIVKSIDVLGRKFVDLANLVPGVNLQWSEFTSGLADGLLEEANQLTAEAGQAFDSFANGDSSKAVSKFFTDVKANAQAAAEAPPKMASAFKQAAEESVDNLKKVTETLADVQKSVDQFGLTEGQKKIVDLKAMGASPEQIAEAEAGLKKLDALEQARKRQDDLQDKAKSVLESIHTPMQAYEKSIGDLDELLAAGMLSWDQYGAAVRKAREGLEGSVTQPSTDAPDLYRSGSAEAAKLVYEIGRGGKVGKDDLGQKQFAEAQSQTRLLQELARNSRITGSELETVEI